VPLYTRWPYSTLFRSDAALHGSFAVALYLTIGKFKGSCLIGIASATFNGAQRLRRRTQNGGTQMVFKTGQRLSELCSKTSTSRRSEEHTSELLSRFDL